MTKAKPKAKPPVKAAPKSASSRDHTGIAASAVGLVANLAVVALFAWHMQAGGEDKPTPNTPFATFEARVRSEVWGAAAAKIRRKEFKDAKAAHTWLREKWPEVEADSFLPIDALEQEAGQDLEKLAAVWEGLSK